MHQSVEVIKEPTSQSVAYPRNLISEHCKCFLQFEAFPISAQSYCLPIHWQITFYCWTVSNNRLHCVEIRWYLSTFLWSAHTGGGKVCENENLIFTQWLPYLELLTGPVANTYTHNTQRASSCLHWVKEREGKGKEKGNQLFQVNECTFFLY